MVVRSCAFCAREFTRKNNAQKYCTARCRLLSKRKGSTDSFRCVQCGTSCTPGKHDVSWSAKRYCGASCRKRDIAGHPPMTRWVEGSCPECGERFLRDQRKYTSVFCSSGCGHRARQRDRRGLGASPKQTRAILYEIAQRDGWNCGICRGSIDPDFRWPDERSAVLDHIVPLARGGEHTPENLQLAHHLCNARKGARIPAEMELEPHGSFV